MTLNDLQQKIKKAKLDAYIVTRNNMFLGQDILDEENKIQELTGFSGSAGTLLVLQDKAILFVDGRYDIQARQETNPQEVEVVCYKGNILTNWLHTNIADKKFKLGFNPWCHSINEINLWSLRFPNISFIADKKELLGNRISSKKFKTFEHDIEFAGINRDEKIGSITKLTNKEFSAILITAADSVSWLLNLRSDCLPNTPILRAYALIDKNGQVELFGENLDIENIHSFSELPKYLKIHKAQPIWFDNHTTPYAITFMLSKNKDLHRRCMDPCQDRKAQKNPIEIAGIKKAHLRDGIAMVKFLHWLESNWQGKTELDIVKQLYDFRKVGDNFYSNSFDTIAGFGSNGAIVHYHPTPETNLELKTGSLLLLDSGAQYYDGTTDITRTIAIGQPSQEMIDNNTIVLKAHIALSNAVFPQENKGMTLDTIARQHLWQVGKDYAHGTGHGVGCFLNVHEGPIGISTSGSHDSLKANMITSIEPGYYKENQYGIRIENLARVINAEDENFDKPSLKFETLTYAPIDKHLINKYLLDNEEITWLNSYHQNVYEKLSSYLDDSEKTWLKDACSPL